MMNKIFKCDSKEQRLALLAALLQLGYKWHGEDELTTAESIEKVYQFEHYPSLCLQNNSARDTYFSGNSQNSNVTMEELLTPINKTETIVVEGHKAYVDEEGLHVGCNTLTLNSVSKLVKLVENFKEG